MVAEIRRRACRRLGGPGHLHPRLRLSGGATVREEPPVLIKVLYCIDSIGRGGTETQLVGLINRLDRRRFAPSLCTLRPSSDYIGEADCPRLELDAGRLFSPSGISRLRALADHMRRERFGIVQTFFQDPTALGMTAARLAGVPVRIISFRDLGFWRTPAQEFLMRRLYPLATGFLANSDAVRHHVCVRDRLDPDRIRVIRNGIDVDRYRFTEHPESAVAVGIVGNLNRTVKRADLFLKAAARVAVRHPETTWHLIGDGELRPRYEAMAAELGLAGRTVFAGRIADVPAYLQRLAIGVMCSDTEGFSNAVLEYMLGGCAVVATSVGGNLEVVHDGRTGLLVPPGNDVALASALARLIEERTTRALLARQARAMVERDFGWEPCVAAHEEYYRAAVTAAGVQ
jgi:L-malate glycosyltransferase